MAKPSTPHTSSASHAEPEISPDRAPAELAPAAAPPAVVSPPGPPSSSRMVTVCIPADAEFVLAVRLAVTGVAARMKFSFDQIEEIKLAVSEACNNAILHARPAEPERPLSVTVQLVPGDEQLEIWVTDEGHVPPPGLPLHHPVATAPGEQGDDGTVDAAGYDTYDPLSDLPEGGLGLLLIRKLMDEVEHFTGADHHTSVRMVKRIDGNIGSNSTKRPHGS